MREQIVEKKLKKHYTLKKDVKFKLVVKSNYVRFKIHLPPDEKVLRNVSRNGSTLNITNPLVVPHAKQPKI